MRWRDRVALADALLAVRQQVGTTAADCQFAFGGIPFKIAQRSMELFAHEVLPRAKHAAPPTPA